MAKRPIIDLDVKGDGASRWKLTWHDPKGFLNETHFHVDSDLLVAISDEVRLALQGLVEAIMEGGDSAAALVGVARQGAELKKALFRGEGENAKKAREIRDDFLPQRGDCMILISLDQRVYVPWGLVYDGDPDGLPQDPQELQSNFWCVKYRVSALYNMVSRRMVERPRSVDKARMMTVVNEDCWTAATQSLPATEQKLFESVWEWKGKPVLKSSKEFFKEWKKEHPNVDVLFFYCHADGSNLALSGDDMIPMRKFMLDVVRDEDYPVCLVFLNGCQTALGAERGGFMEATGVAGFCGFIGTEAKVPDLFALRFATDFFCHLLYDEMEVGEILHKLREQHWPLSLIYSCWCHPFFKIKRDGGRPAPKKPQRNLSLEPERLKAAKML